MSKLLKIGLLALFIASWLPRDTAIAEPYIETFVKRPPTVSETIVKWATTYNTSSVDLIRVAKCESGLNPKALNPKDTDGLPAYGLYQFKKGTFLYFAKAANIDNPDIWNTEHQAQSAAYAFSVGQKKQWGCK